ASGHAAAAPPISPMNSRRLMCPSSRVVKRTTSLRRRNCVVHHGKIDRRMSESGQKRRIRAVRNISALPPKSGRRADILAPPLGAITGREQTQQGSLLFDQLVGAQQ